MTPNLFNTYEELSVPEIQLTAFELTDEELALVDGGNSSNGHDEIDDYNRGGGGGGRHRYGGHRYGGHRYGRHRGGHYNR
jgi:hypothetical protein